MRPAASPPDHRSQREIFGALDEALPGIFRRRAKADCSSIRPRRNKMLGGFLPRRLSLKGSARKNMRLLCNPTALLELQQRDENRFSRIIGGRKSLCFSRQAFESRMSQHVLLTRFLFSRRRCLSIRIISEHARVIFVGFSFFDLIVASGFGYPGCPHIWT